MKNVFFIAILGLTIACSTGQSVTPEQKMESEKWNSVMDNHNVVMPMMGTTNKVRKSLKILKKETEGLDESSMTTINALIADLDEADESMMDWMQGYQKLSKLQETKSHTEIMQYLSEEEKKIKRVKELMDSSIANGESFLKDKK